MDHPLDVGVVQRLGHLSADPQPLVQEQVAPAAGEARPVHRLHDQEREPFRLAEVIQTDDPVVNQPRQDLGLEPDLVAIVVGAGFLEQLNGNVPPEHSIGRPVDGAHAALAEFLLQGKSSTERRAYADHSIPPAKSRSRSRSRGTGQSLRSRSVG
jgi:hypothetical protein